MRELVRKALFYAKNAHEGQHRRGGEDYFVHPLCVYEIVCLVSKDDAVLCAALLHDVAEDTSVRIEDIEREFGKRVADLVAELTNNKNEEAHIVSREGLIVKLADVLHNVSCEGCTEAYLDKKRRFLRWVLDGQK